MPLRIGIAKYTENDFPSCNFSNNFIIGKLFISSSIKPLYDGCGPLVRRETVALEKGVRFSPVVLFAEKATRTESPSVVLMKILRSKIELSKARTLQRRENEKRFYY